jgi:chitinase
MTIGFFGVSILGYMPFEGIDTYLVKKSNVGGASDAVGQATGTISNDDSATQLPSLSIADATTSEGRRGTKNLVFTVKLSAASASAVSYSIATGNLTAIAGSDYAATSLAGQVIPAGSTSKAFSVPIYGDLVKEPNETFSVTASAVSGASTSDGYAIGTITNDDRR